MRTFICNTVFMLVFLAMMAPLFILAAGITPHAWHALIGLGGLVMFFVLPASGFYGERQ